MLDYPQGLGFMNSDHAEFVEPREALLVDHAARWKQDLTRSP
jgi:hypothetical protein